MDFLAVLMFHSQGAMLYQPIVITLKYECPALSDKLNPKSWLQLLRLLSTVNRTRNISRKRRPQTFSVTNLSLVEPCLTYDSSSRRDTLDRVCKEFFSADRAVT